MKEFLIGSYAPKGKPSIFGVKLDDAGKTMALQWGNSDVENPSFLYLHPNGRVMYAVEERVPDGGVAVLVKKGERWQIASRLPAGSAPCHLEMDDAHSLLFVSNYMDGTISVYAADADGVHLEPTACVRHSGKGKDPVRQEGPHVHSCLYHEGKIYAADLGLDTVFVYDVDKRTGTLHEAARLAFPPGCGVRHSCVCPAHPELLYVDAELSGEVFVTERETGRILQRLKAVPEDYHGAFRTSAIKACGDRLCVTTRECNAIAMYGIGQDGLLLPGEIYAHRQQTPRDIWFGGCRMITTDEGSHGLTLLQSDPGQTVTQLGFVSTGEAKPTCMIEA